MGGEEIELLPRLFRLYLSRSFSQLSFATTSLTPAFLCSFISCKLISRLNVQFSVTMDPLNTTKERLLRVAGELLSLADQST